MNKYNRVLISAIQGTKPGEPLPQIPIRSLDEYKKIAKKNNKNCGGICEIVGLNEYQVKPYFDIDDKNGILEDGSIIYQFIDDIKSIYNNDVYTAYREPRLVDAQMKYSWRVYIKAKILYENIPIVFKPIIDKYNELYGKGFIDTSVYNTNKRLLTPLSTMKRNEPVPELKVLECDIFDCCATYIKEDYEDLDIKFKDIIDKKNIQISKTDEIKDDDDEFDNDKYKKLQNLINKLKDERADTYDNWINMMWCINNIANKEGINDEKIKRLMHLFSKKSKSNYDEDKVDKWIDDNLNKCRDNGYGWKYLYETCIKNDAPDYYNNITKSYYNVKKDFEVNNAKIVFPPCIISNYKEQYKIQHIKSLKLSYQHLKCTVKVISKCGKVKYEEKAFVDVWLNDAKIRYYNIMVHKPPPLIVDKDEFNLWTDFKIIKVPYIQEKKDYVINELLSYMKNLLVNDDVVNFLLAYFAQRLQKPAYRCKVLICLFGEEGDGKNRLFDIFKNIFDDKFIEIESAELLYEKHSIIERDRLIVCVNEATSVGFSNSEKLKSRITTDTLLINEKGINPYNIDNYCDYLYTTNNPNALDVRDGSRRYLAIQVSSHYNRNVEFFNKFSNEIVDNKDSLKIIYEYLMSFDVSSIITSGNFQSHIPNTEFQTQLKTDNKDKIEWFLRDLVKDWTEKDERLKAYKNDEFFTKWREWLSVKNIKNDYNAISFGTRLGLLIKKKKWQSYIHKDTHSNTMIDFKELQDWFDKNP
jgi:hypothetical protein